MYNIYINNLHLRPILPIMRHFKMIKGKLIKVLAKVLVFYSVMAVPRGCTKFEIITTVINFPEWLLLSEKELNLVPWEINNIVKYFIIVSKIFEEATNIGGWVHVKIPRYLLIDYLIYSIEKQY